MNEIIIIPYICIFNKRIYDFMNLNSSYLAEGQYSTNPPLPGPVCKKLKKRPCRLVRIIKTVIVKHF